MANIDAGKVEHMRMAFVRVVRTYERHSMPTSAERVNCALKLLEPTDLEELFNATKA